MVPYSLGLGWKDQDSKELLTTLALHDMESEVRTAAVGAIISGFPAQKWVCEVLRVCVGDTYYWVRCLAVNALGESFFHEAGIQKLLTSIYTSDKSEDVRREAFKVLERQLGSAAGDLLNTALLKIKKRDDPFADWS